MTIKCTHGATLSNYIIMIYYIQRRSINHNYLETIDEFDTLKEAYATAKEYQMADYSADYYVSPRCCKAWRES